MSEAQRERLAAMLHMLPPSLRRALLDDAAAKARLEIPTRPVTTIRDDLAFDSTTLTEALRTAFSTGVQVEITSTTNQVVSLQAEGTTIVLATGIERLRLADLAVLASDASIRSTALSEYEQSMLSLPPKWQEIRSRIENAPQTFDVLNDLTTFVSSSPLRQFESLARKLEEHELGFIDLCPLDGRYWTYLVGSGAVEAADAAALSSALASARELMIAHAGLLKAAPFVFSSSGSYALSPRVTLAGASNETILSCIPSDLSVAAPFSLIAILETLAGRPAEGPLDDAASKIVAHFAQDADWLGRSSEAFTVMFRVCIAQLAAAPNTDHRSWAWRRLAAFTQANIVTPLLLKDWENRAEFVAWMRDNSIVLYRIRTALDAQSAPRWRDDWVEPENIRAEIFGRLRQICFVSPDSAARWGLAEKIEGLVAKAEEDSLPQAARFAGPLEGDRESAPRAAPEDADAIESAYVAALRADPGFIQLAKVIYAAATAPPLAGLRSAVEDVAKGLSITLLRNPATAPVAILLSLAWSAAVFSSESLAEQVLRLTMGLDEEERDAHVEACCITFLYAAGAFAETDARNAFIKRSFEALAQSLVDKRGAWTLLEIIRNGLSIEPDLDRLLAKAAIAARLGAMRR